MISEVFPIPRARILNILDRDCSLLFICKLRTEIGFSYAKLIEKFLETFQIIPAFCETFVRSVSKYLKWKV